MELNYSLCLVWVGKGVTDLKERKQEGKPSDFNCTKTFNTGQKYT